MLIGLISDTHVPESGKELWPQVYDRLRGVDLILHAGDLHVLDVVDWLEQLAPIYVARGNGDDGSGGRPLVPEDPRLREAWVLELEGFKVGLIHDLPLPEWPPYRTIDKTMDYYFKERVDVIVHGHTHVHDIRTVRGVLCLNPGSPVFPRNLTPRLGTLGFLEIQGGRIRPWIEQLTPDGSEPKPVWVKST
jgi:putative phosphoesterase